MPGTATGTATGVVGAVGDVIASLAAGFARAFCGRGGVGSTLPATEQISYTGVDMAQESRERKIMLSNMTTFEECTPALSTLYTLM